VQPYYQDKWVKIIHGDCREILPEIHFDITITDPPYNQEYHYDKYADNLSNEDYMEFLKVIKLPAVVIHYPEPSINLLPKVFGECREIVSWVYKNPLPVVKDFRLVTWWGVNPDFTKAKEPYAEATLNDKRAEGKHNPEGRSIRDWWEEQTVRFPSCENTDHPCQIPLSVMRKIILITEGAVILDPFMGSGTTLRAAKDLTRNCIGIEISEKYCEIAAKRCSQEVMELAIE